MDSIARYETQEKRRIISACHTRPLASCPMWHPWRALRRLAHIDLFWVDTDTTMGRSVFQPPTIELSNELTQAERRSTLAHELIHHERGPAWRQHEHREEQAVEREAARRLISIRDLGEALAWSEHLEVVADELWVDVQTLWARLESLHPAERHYLRRRLKHLMSDDDHP